MPPLNLRGYVAPDPLDAPIGTKGTSRLLLHMGVTFLCAVAVVMIAFGGGVAELMPGYSWMKWVECVAIAAILAPLVYVLRKSSSVLFILMLMGVGFPLDLFIQAHFRDLGEAALWTYPVSGCIGAWPPMLQFAFVWGVDGLVVGPVALALSRLLARQIWGPPPIGVSVLFSKEHAALFKEEWLKEDVADPLAGDRLMFWFFRIIGFSYLGYLALIGLAAGGISPWPQDVQELLVQSYENPIMTVNTFIKVSIMAALLFAAAYNKGLRYHASLLLLIGHGVSVVASLVFYLLAPPETPYRSFLLMSVIVDGLFIAVFAWAMWKFREQAKKFGRDKEFPAFYSLPHMLTKWFYYGIFASMTGVGVAVIVIRFACEPNHTLGVLYGFPDPQVSNTLTMYFTIAALCFLIAEREALRERLVGVLIIGFSISCLLSGVWLLVGDLFGGVVIHTRDGHKGYADWFLILNTLMDGGVVIGILYLRKMFYDVEYTINVLSPSSARNVIALHGAFFGPKGPQDDTQDQSHAFDEATTIMERVDQHVGGIRGRKRGLMSYPFWALEHVLTLLYGLRPAFSAMSVDHQRAFMKKYLLRHPDARAKSTVPMVADLTFMVINALHALLSLARYSHISGWEAAGFVPPGARDRMQGQYSTSPPPFAKIAEVPNGPKSLLNNEEPPPGPIDWDFTPKVTVDVIHPDQAPDEETTATSSEPEEAAAPTGLDKNPLSGKTLAPLIAPRVVTRCKEASIIDGEEVDYLIVGSGAGGATMAYRLATKVADPTKILVIERGARTNPTDDMNDHEMQMVRTLYKEGGLQQSKRFDMMVLQGECLGGTTVINNSVCVEMPPALQSAWKDQFGLDHADLVDHFKQIGQELEIDHVAPQGINGALREIFERGVNGFNAKQPAADKLGIEVVKVNHRNSMGEGMGNLGNARMRKRSMLETYIPWAEARGVRFVTETSAVRILDPSKRATQVLVRTKTGAHKRIKVNKAVIVAGGVIASSHFLMRSDITENIGKGVSCNLAIPITVEFDAALKAYDGVQITMGATMANNHAMFETFSNTPGLFSIELPFYFHKHTEIMGRYPHLVNMAGLVGAEAVGQVSLKPDPLNGRALTWDITEQDKDRIKEALITLVEISRAAGGKRAFMATEPGMELKLDKPSVRAFIDALRAYPMRMADFRMFTSHPLGGNRMAAKGSPMYDQCPVDDEFRLKGWDNVYVVDGSVCPTSTTINPQWTIMALASRASTIIS